MPHPLTRQLLEAARNDIYRFSAEPFRLASGILSNHYFNCKRITMHPGRLSLMARALRDELIPLSGEAPEAIGGLTMGADPIAYALSLAYHDAGRTCFPLIVRKEAKQHGTGQRIEGEAAKVKSVLLIDDVVTTAGSALKALEAFRQAGLFVQRAICIVDREEGGREALRIAGVELFSLFKKSDFIAGA